MITDELENSRFSNLICGHFLYSYTFKIQKEVAMYRILNPMNHNVSLVRNGKGEEVIVIGKGITFGKKKGDLISENQVEKIFRMKTEESRENFQTLLRDIPLDILTIGYSTIDEVVEKYHFPIQEYLYVTLTDHLYSVYKKLLSGSYQKSHLPDISNEYVTEFSMARDTIKILNRKLSIVFPEDEIARIALHYINAKGEYELSEELTENVAKRVLSIVENELSKFHIERNTENSNLYDRLMIHLSYLVNRLQNDKQDMTPLIPLEEHVKLDYPKAYQIGQRIHQVIERELNIDLSRSERVYLVLHIQRLLK